MVGKYFMGLKRTALFVEKTDIQTHYILLRNGSMYSGGGNGHNAN